ncbi:hypothetical protein [Mucilaginibacter ginsenosidivorax]|uniref:MipA/OmpV family protein n=1 Tax=Mucilaginibacter ginsenosidivorax TaxID=862126 RepID=A0A5B8VWW0_9SPHI|nr:hypothetical protein [Mucilaginibacter ginsenosidivorax]QEC75402.1 hypothetical protein FSB76_05375 [Mucilaginibacter ginsenosidivorax]
MKIIYASLLIPILCLLCAKQIFAQSNPTDKVDKTDKTDKDDKAGSFKFGINYLSNNVIMGRADTIKTPMLIPDIKYTFSNGIYFSGSVTYIPNRITGKLDEGNLTGGYDFDITDNLSAETSFSKLFYNKNSTQIGSSINSTINASLDYDISGIVTPTIGADYNFVSKGFKNDVFVNAGLSHDFITTGIINDDDFLVISPLAEVNGGTQNFYDAYLTQKKYKLAANTSKALAKQKARLSKFNLLDYEFSVPMAYKVGVLILHTTPSYAISQNKLPANITGSMINKPGIFYFDIGATIKL